MKQDTDRVVLTIAVVAMIGALVCLAAGGFWLIPGFVSSMVALALTS